MGSGGVSPKTSTTDCSPAPRLPLEVVEMIIAYLKYDTRSLRACTLTCHSWYIIAVPHLHHTLTVSSDLWKGGKFRWPNSVRSMHTLGLLPLVKEFRIRGRSHGFSSMRFDSRTLRQFSALTNVQKLEIGRLDIPNFIPKIHRYFSHFLPTVKSLVLKEPSGSCRQIIYFIGLFQNLQDLELSDCLHFQEERAADSKLIPAFVPPLRGLLVLGRLNSTGLLKDMVDLFGGIRFRYVNLYRVDGMRLLLGACAKTLESVMLYPTDPLVESSLGDFDLSRNKSLRTLWIPVFPIHRPSNDDSRDATLKFLKHVLSTIKSSSFSKITVLYGDRDFRGGESWSSDRPLIRALSQAERAEEVSRHRKIFEVFREARKVRSFRLRLFASVWGAAGEESVRILEEAIAEEKAENGFKRFRHDPVVQYNPHRSRF